MLCNILLYSPVCFGLFVSCGHMVSCFSNRALGGGCEGFLAESRRDSEQINQLNIVYVWCTWCPPSSGYSIFSILMSNHFLFLSLNSHLIQLFSNLTQGFDFSDVVILLSNIYFIGIDTSQNHFDFYLWWLASRKIAFGLDYTNIWERIILSYPDV